MWIELSVCPAVCVPGSRVLLTGVPPRDVDGM
jgi:hypothetical protein